MAISNAVGGSRRHETSDDTRVAKFAGSGRDMVIFLSLIGRSAS
jgi:hypothetical protein